MAFYETRFPVDISNGSAGGPRWKTDVVVMASGNEQRNQRWSEVRNVYDVSYGVKTRAQLQSLVEFFNEMRGRAHGFRYKDWADFQVTDEPITPTAGPTYQLVKTYGNGFNDYSKNITKPVSGTVSIKQNGSAYGGTVSVDTTTGIVTLGPLSTIDILGITQANPGVITTDGAHGLSNGDEVYLSSIGGMTELNGVAVTVTVVDADEFSIGVNTSAYTAYTTGGTVEQFIETGDTMTWSGQYDIPCRFDTDEISISLETYELGATSIPIVELKI